MWNECRAWYRRSGLTQEALATKLGVSQSTVQRLLSKEPARRTKALLLLCKYAEIEAGLKPRTNPARNPKIEDALRLVWDGSEGQAKALARVIRSLRGLSKARS